MIPRTKKTGGQPSARAVFLDKDGTLIADVPHNVDPARIRLLPGAAAALARLQDAGFELIDVTNQPGVALGLFPASALEAVDERVRDLLSGSGVRLSGFLHCPHHPGGRVKRYAIHCSCRKPAPGMLVAAARERRLELAACWCVGDILDDVEAGRRAGTRTVLIDNGNETEWRISPGRSPDFLAHDLEEAAHIIVSTSRGLRPRLSTQAGRGRS